MRVYDAAVIFWSNESNNLKFDISQPSFSREPLWHLGQICTLCLRSSTCSTTYHLWLGPTSTLLQRLKLWWFLLPFFKLVTTIQGGFSSMDFPCIYRYSTVYKNRCKMLQCIIISIKREHPLASHTSSGRNPSTTAKCSIFNARAISCKLSGEDHHGSFPAPWQKFSLQTKLFDIDVQLLKSPNQRDFLDFPGKMIQEPWFRLIPKLRRNCPNLCQLLL